MTKYRLRQMMEMKVIFSIKYCWLRPLCHFQQGYDLVIFGGKNSLMKLELLCFFLPQINYKIPFIENF